MKKKSIFGQLLFPMIAIVCVLALILTGIIAAIFSKTYENEMYSRGREKSLLVSSDIATFMDGAYGITEELSVNPSILTMETDVQTPILEDCVKRNSYLELLYIQGTDGMQTGRSSGELADRSTRWWFTQTMEEKKAFVSKSYYSVNTGMPCASIFYPMYRGGELTGVFAVDIKLDYLQSLIDNFSDIEHGEYSFVIDGEGVVVAHPDSTQIEELYNYSLLTKTVSKKDNNGQPLMDADGAIITEEQSIAISEDYQEVIADVMAGNSGSRKMKNDGETYFVSYASIPLKGESDSWSVITLHKESAAMAVVYKIILTTILIAVLVIAVAAFIIALLARRLTNPVVTITELIKNASDGDFTVRAPEDGFDEIGTLSKSLNKMTAKISVILSKLTGITSEVVQSSGNLKNIESEADSISRAVREISDGAETQNDEIHQVVMKAEALEENFEQLQKKNSLLLQDAQNTMLSGENGMSRVSELKAQNESTSQQMAVAFEKIQLLEERSQKISGILNTINEISSQTGLLALNASIEAARAGEQGRGFSVVAESIGKLATDSSLATADIEKIIVELCKDISDTVANIETIRSNIEGQTEVVDKVQNTFSDFRVLAEKTKESVRNMELLVKNMHESNHYVVQAVEKIRTISTNTAELTDKAADSLEEQLRDIRNVSERIDALSQVSTEMEQEMTKFKLA